MLRIRAPVLEDEIAGSEANVERLIVPTKSAW
jgi:hypothetical protein